MFPLDPYSFPCGTHYHMYLLAVPLESEPSEGSERLHLLGNQCPTESGSQDSLVSAGWVNRCATIFLLSMPLGALLPLLVGFLYSSVHSAVTISAFHFTSLHVLILAHDHNI